jgi:hypothetical protein
MLAVEVLKNVVIPDGNWAEYGADEATGISPELLK